LVFPIVLLSEYVGSFFSQVCVERKEARDVPPTLRGPLPWRQFSFMSYFTLCEFKTNNFPQPYHLTHHKSLGVDGLDTDLPTSVEAIFLDSLLGKAFFCTFQILFYAVRPIFIYKVPFTSIHFINIFVQLLFDFVLVKLGSPQSLKYLILSSFLAGSLHPCAGHFIAEHYIFQTLPPSAKNPANHVPVPETFSYYGPLNLLTYNVGLHNEHHDFPAIPWTRLPKVNEIAKEFYDELPRHESWVFVIWQFVLDKNVGMTSRLKRREGGRKVGAWTQQEVEA
jgi:sphingolipid delta-4 desaturase